MQEEQVLDKEEATSMEEVVEAAQEEVEETTAE